MNPLTIFSSLKAKLIVLASVAVLSFGSGVYVTNVWYDAKAKNTVEKKLEKAKAAPGKIIKFNQEMRKTDAEKDSCANVPIPPAVLDLLYK
jgi:hypothetical protein